MYHTEADSVVQEYLESPGAFHEWLLTEKGRNRLVGQRKDAYLCPIAVFLGKKTGEGCCVFNSTILYRNNIAPVSPWVGLFTRTLDAGIGATEIDADECLSILQEMTDAP